MKNVSDMMGKTLLALLIGLFCTGSLFAENEKHGASLETVVVTAEKIDESFQTGDVDIGQTPAFYSFIKRESFEGKIENLGEVLKKEVGVQIRQSGGLGSFSSVSLRGSSSDQVMVFMDGVLLNDASFGGVDLSNIALSDVEAIEVYRGVTPLNFGKASIGGVVNIRTLRSAGDLKRSVTLGAGSFDTRKASGFINHKPGKWDYLISADYLASENDFWIRNDNGTDFWLYDDEWQRRRNNDFCQANLLTKLGCDFSGDVRLDFSNQFFSKDQSIPSWNNDEETETTFDTRRNNTILKLTADNVGPFNMSGYVDYSWKEELYDDRVPVPNGGIGLGMQYNKYLTTSYGGHYLIEWPTDWNTATLMVDLRREEYSPEDLLFTGRNPKDSSRDTLTVGGQDTLFLFGERISIVPALRYYRVKDKLESAVSAAEIPLEGREECKDYYSPQAGIKVKVFDGFILKSNIARYTREPSFFELFGDRGLFLGNEDLVAEEGVNFDAGFLLNQRFDSPWFSRFALDAAYFRSDMENLITRTYDARGVGKSVNVEGAFIEGVEAELRMDLLWFFSLVANATWQDATNENRQDEFYGKKLPGRFDTSYLGRLEAKYRGFKVYGEYLHESGMYYDTANLLEAKDKEELNVGGSLLFNPFLLTVEGKNLENNRYEDFNGYYMPGRSFYVTLKYNF